jgi:hypothetical protein
VLDYHQDYPPTCVDCLSGAASPDRVERGGSYEAIPFFLSVAYRSYAAFDDVSAVRGFRCARDLD